VGAFPVQFFTKWAPSPFLLRYFLRSKKLHESTQAAIPGGPAAAQAQPCVFDPMPEHRLGVSFGSAELPPAIPNLAFLNHTAGVCSQLLGGGFLTPPYPAAPALPFPPQAGASVRQKGRAPAGMLQHPGGTQGGCAAGTPPVCFAKGRVASAACGFRLMPERGVDLSCGITELPRGTLDAGVRSYYL
jgi:hypothetical protein